VIAPALVHLGGFEARAAVTAPMVGYLCAGLMGAVVYARHGSIRWRPALALCCGAAPAAYAGALAVPVLPAGVLELGMALLLILTGVNAVRRTSSTVPSSPAAPLPGAAALTLIGAAVGFLSVATGTGGPVILVPLLLWLGLPILAAVGLTQVIQVPIGALAAVASAVQGMADWPVALLLAIGLTGGAWLGARIAHRVPQARLHRWLGVVLIAAALFIAARLVPALVASGA